MDIIVTFSKVGEFLNISNSSYALKCFRVHVMTKSRNLVPIRACVLVLVAGLQWSAPSPAQAVAGRPNVVLIISDYMGYRDIEPYGATDIRTPSLSRLASEGVRMTNFYAAAPVCGPARAALYTGQYPARVGFESNIRTDADGLSSSIESLPSWLGEAGYRTALFGKWHLGSGPEFTPNAHGFDEFFGHHQWTISYYNHKTEQGEPGLFENDQIVNREGYLTDLLTGAAVSFIERYKERPFFLTLAYNAALPPYQPPGLPEAEWNDGWDVNEASRTDYVRMVERMDHGIGAVLDKLDEEHLSDNTLVIYTYDHGGRHLVDSTPLFHGFANLWEGGIRTPLIMRLPGVIDANEKSPTPGIAMDITATILDVTGLSARAESLDGISLIPILRGDIASPTRQMYWQADFYNFGKQRAIREGDWKFIEHDNTQFLFDLSESPDERDNQYNRRQDIANRLRSSLDQWQAEISGN